MMHKNMRYKTCHSLVYYSKRYNKIIKAEAGFDTDGATGAIDIRGKIEAFDTWNNNEIVYVSLSWIIHDKLCDTGLFDDGTKCSNWQASTILSDILRDESRWLRAIYWWPSTFLFGGGKCRGK